MFNDGELAVAHTTTAVCYELGHLRLAEELVQGCGEVGGLIAFGERVVELDGGVDTGRAFDKRPSDDRDPEVSLRLCSFRDQRQIRRGSARGDLGSCDPGES